MGTEEEEKNLKVTSDQQQNVSTASTSNSSSLASIPRLPSSPELFVSPSKLIQNFNDSNNLDSKTESSTPPSLLQTPTAPDALNQIASALQHLVTRFTEIGNQHEHFYRRQMTQQSFSSTAAGALELSLARPAPGQFEDIENIDEERSESQPGDDPKEPSSDIASLSVSSASVRINPDDDEGAKGSSSATDNGFTSLLAKETLPLEQKLHLKPSSRITAEINSKYCIKNNLPILGVDKEQKKIQAHFAETERDLPVFEDIMYIHNRNEAIEKVGKVRLEYRTQQQ